MRRSISWRASTASDSFLLGSPSVAIARLISRGITAENRARNTVSRGLAPRHTFNTCVPFRSPRALLGFR
jgi:hypothetical protein